MLKRTLSLITATLPLMFAGHALAESNPYAQGDDTWVTLSGTAVDTQKDGFTLDYGAGLVQVEMDARFSTRDAQVVNEDNKVTVYGRIDDDLFEKATIEADSVFVENSRTYFHPVPADEEAVERFDMSPLIPVQEGDISVSGTISSIDGRTFTITATGGRGVTVDTSELHYNPLDRRGQQQLNVGDYVTVHGRMDERTLAQREFTAKHIIALAP